MENEELAEKLVDRSINIGRKKNPGIEKAREKFGERVLEKLREEPEEVEKKVIEEVSKPEYGPLIYEKDGELEFKKEVGHSVVITCNPENQELGREVEKKCLENGAHTLLLTKNSQRLKESYNLPPEDSLREITELSKSLASEPDYSVKIEPSEQMDWKKDIPKERLSASSPVKQKIYSIRDENQVRWAYIGWPHPEIAENLEISSKEFEKILKASMEQSFKEETIELIEHYHELMTGSDEVRIESEEGTELFMSVEGRHFLKDDGILSEKDIERGDIGMNFPCGELFVAPVEDSAEGKIYVPKSSISSYGSVEDIWIEFENGEIVDYSAEKNEKYLDRFFRENVGEIKRIAELGIGCNKAAEYTDGYILIDEKIFGTLHFAVGWNVGYGGKNEASSHHDFIKPMDNGRMYADDELVMDEGEPV